MTKRLQTQEPPSARVAAAIAKSEQALREMGAAVDTLAASPAGPAFDAAWQRYERCLAAFQFSRAETQVAFEDAHNQLDPTNPADER